MKSKLQSQNECLQKIPALLLQDSNFTEFDLDIKKFEKVWIVAVGKGALKTVQAISKKYASQIVDGLVISQDIDTVSKEIQVFPGSHPIPSVDTVASSYELLNLIREIPEGNTLIFCISGGASSMLTIPPYGIEIEEINDLYSKLLGCGASIQEMNIVRKHVCDLKGGKLAEEAGHLKLISVIESDVPEGDLSTIGSGPTVPDPSTFIEAVRVLKNFEIWDTISLSIQEHLIGGVEGNIPENPKPSENEHPRNSIKILSGKDLLRKKIEAMLSDAGYSVWCKEEDYSGNVQIVSKEICGKAISVLSNKDAIKKPAALIYQGESSVKVKKNGKGGRNQELALMAAISIEGQHTISILSMDTDGIDGPTDAAGAIVNSNTTLLARKNKLEPEKLLLENNSYEFHEQAGTHLVTGSTGINLMDLQVVLID